MNYIYDCIRKGLILGNPKLIYETETPRMYAVKERSGVIICHRSEYIDYSKMKRFEYWGVQDLSASRMKTRIDDYRRISFFKKYLKDAIVVDYGCGNAGFLMLVQNCELSDYIAGIEKQEDIAEIVRREDSIPIRNSIDKLDFSFDIVTMFHVFEHLINPIDTLKEVYKKMIPGGILIIELPHAGDILLRLGIKGFLENTFKEMHFILHTEKSLRTFTESVGFKVIKTGGIQRYSFMNHLNWFINGEVNKKYGLVENQYSIFHIIRTWLLHLFNCTDTIYLIARKL
jgi:SAM-dependent methyltransferase